MNRIMAGLLGVGGALVASASAQAASSPAPHSVIAAPGYTDVIPGAAETLTVQYYPPPYYYRPPPPPPPPYYRYPRYDEGYYNRHYRPHHHPRYDDYYRRW